MKKIHKFLGLGQWDWVTKSVLPTDWQHKDKIILRKKNYNDNISCQAKRAGKKLYFFLADGANRTVSQEISLAGHKNDEIRTTVYEILQQICCVPKYISYPAGKLFPINNEEIIIEIFLK